MKNKRTLKIAFLTFLSALMILLSAGSGAVVMAAEEPPSIGDLPSDFFGDDDDDDTPPSLDLEEGDTPPSLEAPAADIEIVSAGVFPVNFNPLTTQTKVTYELSEEADVTVEIVDRSGALVATLVNGETLSGDVEHFVWWDGKNNSGDIVESTNKTDARRDYSYKIVARDSGGVVQDTATGAVTVAYVNTVQPNNLGANTITTHNNPPSQTSQTGPGVLLYLALPAVAGLWVGRKK